MEKEFESTTKKDNEYFGIITRHYMGKLKIADILYFESEGRKVHIYTKTRRISYNGSIEKIEGLLGKKFLNCHGSFIVNLAKITGISGNSLEVEGGHIIPVSQRRSPEIKQLYRKYLKKHFPCNSADDIV